MQTEEGGHLGAILKRMGACDSRAIAEALLEQVRVTRDKGKARETEARARESPSLMGLTIHCRPGLTTFLIVVSDIIALGLGTGLAWLLITHDAPGRVQRYGILAVLPLCMLIFAYVNLYAATPPGPPEEIRRATLATTFVCAGMWLVSFLVRSGGWDGVQHLAWILAWLVGVFLVPIFRATLRWKFAKRRWWGQPVVVLGAGRVGRAVVGTLQRRPQLGLKPVAVLDDDPAKHGTLRATWGDDDIEVEAVPESTGEPPKSTPDSPSTRTAWANFSQIDEVPVLGGLELAPVLSQRLKVRFAVVAMPEADSAALLSIIERYAESFQSVLAIPDLFDLAFFGAATRDLGGVLGIEVRRQLLLTGPRLAKRLMDVTITGLGLLMVSPLLIVIALLIKLDSKGSVFYHQKRLGQDGVRFPALKFRTMHGDGERRLQEVLARDPKLRAEYDEFHKLTVDPRVTRVGRFLRKFSLDELPQLLNVLFGDMSLVGPRPYLEREIPEMEQKEAIILRVKPGITGIWQVTERNASTFERRLHMDVEYVRSWSPWLDIYVLARTIPVVLGGTGS
ncbi:MAG: Undecaprenyl-phosphate galactosephosphotransferase [Polyangiaceae bacterium]|nr:Undecaprenyl-phosphate galactosephosphotransferase [Polyangiaceae bacterium]